MYEMSSNFYLNNLLQFIIKCVSCRGTLATIGIHNTCLNKINYVNSIKSLLYFTAELEENSALNSKVWDAAGLRSNGTFPLNYFSYNNSALLDVIFKHVQETNFSGLTVSEGTLCMVVCDNDSYLLQDSYGDVFMQILGSCLIQ